MTLTNILFPLGRVMATEGVLAKLEESGEEPHLFLHRHSTGDWGDLSPHEQALNTLALVTDEGILSVFRTAQDVEFWVNTGPDRSCTCMLLPAEYEEVLATLTQRRPKR